MIFLVELNCTWTIPLQWVNPNGLSCVFLIFKIVFILGYNRAYIIFFSFIFYFFIFFLLNIWLHHCIAFYKILAIVIIPA